MAPTMKKSVYEQVVDVTSEYLGPAAERFVRREVLAHLGKNPEKLTRSDVEKLHEWSRLAIALLTDDEKTVDEYSRNIRAIAKARRER